MGIHGLTGFIDNNQHLLHQHQLHNCSVVLDGNNFCHFLYYACHVQCSFGGDYDIYRKKLISTFDSFKMCGITPYVVMDGAYTVDGRKLTTSLSRASARIRLIDVMANNQRGQALPALAYETFMQTLNQLGVHHATCQFEADNEIAVLANKLQCQVISNDSDFYIFDLSNGFLPLDYLDFRPLETRASNGTIYHYLHCCKYHVDDFINSFDGLSRSVLPVFASLLGNDFINATAFSTFYSRVKVPKIISKKFSLPPRLSKVISVLHWLHTQNDSNEFSDIKRELLEFIKPKRKVFVEKMFVSSVNGYIDVDNFQGFDLFQFFTAGPEQCKLNAGTDFRGYNGKEFPDWFIIAVCRGEITPSILNCAILHRVIILTQVEDLSQPSSYLCSLRLRQVLYGILLQGDNPPAVLDTCNQYKQLVNTAGKPSQPGDTDFSNETSFGKHLGFPNLQKEFQASAFSDVFRSEKECNVEVDNPDNVGIADREDGFTGEDESEVQVCDAEMTVRGLKSEGWRKVKASCIEEYTRINKNLLKNLIEPLSTIGKISVPSLTNLAAVSVDERKAVLMESLGISVAFMNQFSEDLQMFAACLVMWSRNASPKITLAHLDTIIVGVIFLRVLVLLKEKKGELKVLDEKKGDFKEKGDGKLLERQGDLKDEKKGELREKDDRHLSERKVEMKENNCEIRKKKNELSKVSEIKDELIGKSDEDPLTRKDEGDLASINYKAEEPNISLSLFKDSSRCIHKRSKEAVNEKETLDKCILDSIHSKINITTDCSDVSVHDLENIRHNLSKYHTKYPTFNHKNHYNPRISHTFAQLQACMVDAINLNKLLQCPFSNIRPADVINGTFLYNFYTELSSRAKPDLFLAAMLERNVDVISKLKLFRDVIVECVGVDCFVSASSHSTKSRKRKSKRKEKNVDLEETKIGNSDVRETTVKSISGFGVANMFSVLSLEDC